jgi:hypothetical protein
VQRQPKLMFGPPDGRTLCHNCITQHNCAVKTPLFQYLVGGPKEELGAQFEVYRCIAVGLIVQSCFTAVKNCPYQCSSVPGRQIFFPFSTTCKWAAIAQSLRRLAKYWKVRESNPGEGELSAPVQTGPVAQPASCTMGKRSLLGVKRSERGLNQPPHLVPKLKKE